MKAFFPSEARAWREAAAVLALAALGAAAWAAAAGAAAGQAVSATEVAATATSLAFVWLSRTGNILSWPVGLLSFLAFGAFTLHIGLSGQGWLYLLYFAPMQLVGWRQWSRQAATDAAAPTWLGPKGAAFSFAAVLALTAAIRYALAAPDGGLVAWWDSSIAASLAVAIWLMGRRKVESWIIAAVLVNLSGIGLYAMSGNWMFCVLYSVFAANAFAAFAGWARAAQPVAA